MQDLAAFVRAHLGGQVCNYGYCQCVALMNAWLQLNRWPLPAGSRAGELVFPAPWARYPISSAEPGDVVIWGTSLPGSDGDGHVGIYVRPYAQGFQSFDQNWTTACSNGPTPCCCLVEHTDLSTDLSYVVGAYRMPDPPVPAGEPEPVEIVSRPVVVSPA